MNPDPVKFLLGGRANESQGYFMPQPGQRFVARIPWDVSDKTMRRVKEAWALAHPHVGLTVIAADTLAVVDDEPLQRARHMLRLAAEMHFTCPQSVTMRPESYRAVSGFLEAALGS